MLMMMTYEHACLDILLHFYFCYFAQRLSDMSNSPSFAFASLGSPLIGVSIGLIFVFLIGKANRQLIANDVTVQISLSLCCAYISFFVAQISLGISGIISCCGAGIVFAWLSPPIILQPETMHSIWNMLEWIANTLLFLLAGFIIGSDIFYNVRWTDYAYVFLFYIALQIIRLVMVFLLYPLLSRLGLKCKISEANFIAWAGLRGALGISLALLVKEESDSLNVKEMEANRLFFYVGGIATLTLLFNATSTNQMLCYLGIVRNSLDIDKNKKLVMDLIKKGLRRKMRIKLAEVLEEVPTASGADVLSHVDLLVQEELELDSFATGTASSTHLRWKEDMNDFTERDHVEVPIQDVLFYVRAIFLGIVRVEYWRSIERGKLPRESSYSNSLLFSIDYALDRVHESKMRDWDALCENNMTLSPCILALLNALEALENVCCFYEPFKVKSLHLTRHEEMKAYLLTNFVEAHECAQTKIGNFMGRPEGSENVTPEEQAVIAESVASVRLFFALSPR